VTGAWGSVVFKRLRY